MKSMSSRAVTYGLIVLLGLLSALPNVLPSSWQESLPDWYTSNTLTLGLDLRGGSHLLMAIDSSGLILDQNQQLADELVERLREAGIRYTRPQVSESTITVTARDPADADALGRIARTLITEKAQGSPVPLYTSATDSAGITLEINPAHVENVVAEALEQSLEVVRRRLDESGMVDPTIARQGSDSISVQLPGVTEPQRIRELLGTTARMTFHWLARPGASDTMTLEGATPGEHYEVERRVAMEGRHVRGAVMTFSPDTGAPVVNFTLDQEGARLFGDMTTENIGRPLAVVLDDLVITAPVIRSAITGGSGEISGGFTPTDAADLAVMLRAGALPAELNVIEERTVGPNLGSDAIAMGITTGVIGGLLVLAFMIAVYGSWGLIAWFALSINVGLIFGVLSLLGATLTLPGIAGLILSIGMAVDANILINERIREETARGRSAMLALDTGFKKAYSTILDSNVTTLIAISLLFMMGSGPVRGFAVTMGIGLISSMFTAISVTRLLMEWRVARFGRASLTISGLGFIDRMGARYSGGGNIINFMRASAVGIVLSAILSTASVVLLIKPGPEYGIDFSGGALLEVQTASASIEQLRAGMEDAGFTAASIQEFGSATDYLLRLPLQDVAQASGTALIDDLRAAVLSVAPDADFPRSEVVGPRVSGDFADKSILAILLAGLGMLGYLWFRFENHFAIGAILTIALDLTKTLGFFVLAGVEFNLTAVAALLALIGYSVNDKVVVFDRIRENLRLMPDLPLPELVNQSITSTLTRTIFTSASTFVAILPMAIAGGAAVESFALPMLFGIVISTSSSILIAAPIVLYLGNRRAQKGLAQLHIESEEQRRLEMMRP